MDKLTSVVFALLYIPLALILAVLGGMHGPENFPYFVVGYFCIAEAALWWWYFSARRRNHQRKTLMMFAGALLLAVLITVVSVATLSPLSDWEEARHQQVVAATKVFNVRDETLLSPQGNPIGIRLHYSIRFPNSDYFWQVPSLSFKTGFAPGPSIWADGRLTNEVIEPPMHDAGKGTLRYDKGTAYNITADFIPYFLSWNAAKTRLCTVKPPPLYAQEFEELINSGAPTRYGIDILATNFQGFTEHTYDPKTFYDSAEKEGAVQLQGVGPFDETKSACQ